MDQAVGLPALNGCFIDGMFFVVNHLMKFEWNRQKAISNFKKHQIDFEEAVSTFRDPFAKIFNDVWHSENEHRELIIGYSYKHRLLLVSFIERDENVVRIVSARKTTARERLDYEENQRQ